MFLTSYKLGYALSKTCEFIKDSQSYSVLRQSYNPSQITFNRKGSSYSDDEIKVFAHVEKQEIEKIELKIKGNHLSIDYNSKFKEQFKSILDVSFDKIKSIEDKKFLEMFPEYDTQQDRDAKLSDILGTSDTEAVVKELTKKKSWWSMFS